MIIAGFVLFLFVVYLLSRDDFVFLRRNVTLDQIFDTIFLTLIVGTLISRATFVALHFKPSYVNPLIFLLIPYFPGLALSGALIGGSVFAFLYLQYNKYPTARILDIFSIALLFSFSLVEAINGVISLFHKMYINGGIESGLALIVLIVAFIATRFFALSVWRDGGVSLFCLSCLSLLTICWRLVTISLAKHFVFDFEIVVFSVFLLALAVAGVMRLTTKKI